jgi:hypothetical protein
MESGSWKSATDLQGDIIGAAHLPSIGLHKLLFDSMSRISAVASEIPRRSVMQTEAHDPIRPGRGESVVRG